MATQQSIQLRNQSSQSLIAPAAKAALPRFGVLHKGEKAPRKDNGEIARPGKDLSYFRLDTKFPDIQKVWDAAYPDEAARRRINVVMPFTTVDENFERCREHWVRGGLVHRCNGEFTSRLRDKATGKMILDPMPCPGGCELVSRLMFLIPEMIVGTMRVGTFTLNDTSINDIARLKEELQVIYNWRGSLQGVPMVLYRVEEEISQPKSDSDPSRVRRKKWMVHIEVGPEFAKSLIRAMTQEAIASPTGLALSGGQRQLAAAPIVNDLPVSISNLNYQEHGDDDPAPPASDFGEKTKVEDDDSGVPCITGATLLTATSQVAQLKAKGRNGARFTEWLKDNFDAETIDTVAESEGERLIAALAKILAQINAEEAHKPEDRPPSEAMSSLMAMIEVARGDIGKTLVTAACDGFTNGTGAITDLNDDDALALIERLKQAIADKAAKKARPTKPFAA